MNGPLESGKLDIQKMDRFRVPEFVQNEEDGSIEFDTFIFPSFCACHIIDESYL